LDRLVTIELFGQPYSFRAETEFDQAQAVAEDLVRMVEDEKGRQVDHPPAQTSRLAILISVALNIANENHELKTKQATIMGELTHRSASLIHRLDAGLQAITHGGYKI
jgi:cell division protein ZapA (FtsZ GTPase activity inhibitor)